jgi:hypothetical protein
MGGQQIIEVMGYAPGEAANALHLLGVKELLFQPSALGHLRRQLLVRFPQLVYFLFQFAVD